MTKYKIIRMNTGFGDVEFSIARVDKFKDHFSGDMITDLIPVQPIRYYKTKAGAERAIKRLLARG